MRLFYGSRYGLGVTSTFPDLFNGLETIQRGRFTYGSVAASLGNLHLITNMADEVPQCRDVICVDCVLCTNIRP